MQKPAYATLDVRKATEDVIKQCEPVLGKMRTVYLTEKVPPTIADRHLKKLRIQTTRNLLAELMFRDASRKAGH
jgi:pyridoxal/pyridoxine/pyridoxamine kinase